MTNHEKKTSRPYSVGSQGFQKSMTQSTGREYDMTNKELYESLQKKVSRGEITQKQAWMLFNYKASK